jgi:DNA topoisomerase-1
MEERLDLVEDGSEDWVKLLREFYTPFKADLDKAKIEMKDVKREEQPTEHVCEKCGKPMVIKWGRNGHFLACSGYPDCRNTKEYTRNEDGSVNILPSTRPSDQTCPTCSSPMVVRRGRFGEFLACSRYPECKTTSPLSIGVACPRPGCGGYLTEKRSRRGKTFYGCSNYSKTKCDFVSWDKPMAKPCPQCGATFLVIKVSKAGSRVRCVNETCSYAADTEELGASGTPGAAPDAKAS